VTYAKPIWADHMLCSLPTDGDDTWAKHILLICVPYTKFYSYIHLISKRNLFLYLLILLSGDVESNPGPRPASSIFNVCTFNIRSLTNHLHYTALASLAQTHNVDIFALTETWISPNATSAELFDSIPHGFYLVSTPRPVTSSKTSIVGGGTAFVVREPLSLLSSPTFTF
jgi:hypothetical protein